MVFSVVMVLVFAIMYGWAPAQLHNDKPVFASGWLLMGFGLGGFILGKVAFVMLYSPGLAGENFHYHRHHCIHSSYCYIAAFSRP